MNILEQLPIDINNMTKEEFMLEYNIREEVYERLYKEYRNA